MLAACLLLAAAFILFPQIDLAASGLFFRDNAWLAERDSAWLFLPYRGLPRLGQATVLVLAGLWLLSFARRFDRLRAQRATLGFLLAAALVGPVLVVDHALKDHSGRARPINVQPFNGQKQFTPAFVPADQCIKNCAFVSGHVATASFLMAFGWLAAPAVRRRWLVAGAVAGGAMAFFRMAPGGHFLSDAVFAWFAVYFSLWLTEWAFRRLGWLPSGRPAP
jgi:lipid A 4'-phosphatase